MKHPKVKETTLADLSWRVVDQAGLPNGCEVRAYRRKNDRRVRSDFEIIRRHITEKTLPRPRGSTTVAALIEDLYSLIVTDFKARGIVLRLHGPQGQWIDGHTHLKSVREMEPVPVAPGDAEYFAGSTVETPPAGESRDTMQTFWRLLENAGVPDSLTVSQSGSLYKELSKLGAGFERSLIAHADRIWLENAVLSEA